MAIFTALAAAFFPASSRADLDVLSIVQDQTTAAMEKVDNIVKKYTGIQFNLQELSLNRNILSQVKDKVTSELKSRANSFYSNAKNQLKTGLENETQAFLKSSLGGVSLPGIGSCVNIGSFVNPKMSVALGETYLKKQHQQNDMQYMAAVDERSNKEVIENLATVYANALVGRKRIMDENKGSVSSAADGLESAGSGKPDEEKIQEIISQNDILCAEEDDKTQDMKDVNVVKRLYYIKMMCANHRWLKIQETIATYQAAKAKVDMNQGLVDDVSAITGLLPEDAAANGGNTQGSAASPAAAQSLSPQQICGGLDLSSLKDVAKNVKNGDWKGAAGSLAGGAADALDATGNSALAGQIRGGRDLANTGENLANGGSWQDVINNSATVLDDIDDAEGGDARRKKAEDDRAVREAIEKQNAENLQKGLENLKQQDEKRKQAECQKCRANAAKTGSGCITECSFK